MVPDNTSDIIMQKYNLKFKIALPVLIKISDNLIRRHKIFNDSSNLSCMPFFILGSGRNGSTLLSSMLNQHSKIMIPPEQWVLYEMIIKYKLLNFHDWKDIINLLLGLISNENSNEGWNTNFQKLYSKLYSLDKTQKNLVKIIDEIYIHHARENNIDFDIWGDKSPINTIYLKYIFPVYPLSKYIFLVRDGRDVISSYVKVQSYDIKLATWKWNYSIEQYKKLKKKIPHDQLLLIKYEELIDDTEEILKNIVKFLGYKYESKMINFQNSLDYLGVKNLNHHTKLHNKINKSGVQVWQTRLNKEEIDLMVPLINKNLQFMNYI